MTISRHAFELIEQSLHLHISTLPSLFIHGGAFFSRTESHLRGRPHRRIQLVIRISQKVDVADYLLSLSHDVSTHWTDAFLCGHGILRDINLDSHGSLSTYLRKDIIASHALWDNPLLLACTLLQTCNQRLGKQATRIDNRLSNIERMVGIANSAALRDVEHRKWPQNIQAKDITIGLHTMAPQVAFMLACSRWLQDFGGQLGRLHAELMRGIGDEDEKEGNPERTEGMRGLGEVIAYLKCACDAQERALDAAKARVDVLVNLLFSITGQQDNILNRRDNVLNLLIAKSTKQDSISMTTFTFITALFLPGTFTATLFSMSMFNWQPGGNNSGNASGSIDDNGAHPSTLYPSSSSPSPSPQSPASSDVSNNFWIFWLVAVSLTIFTMGGWFLWFRYANRKWTEDLTAALDATVAAADADQGDFLRRTIVASVTEDGASDAPTLPLHVRRRNVYGET